VRGDKIYKKERADQIPTGKYRDAPTGSGRLPQDKEAAKIFCLRCMNTEMNLIKRAEENQHHAQTEQYDGQPQGRESTRSGLEGANHY
jgi:hypothetical protein